MVGATGFESQLHTTRLCATIRNQAVVIDDYSLFRFSAHAHHAGGCEVFLSAFVSRFSLMTLTKSTKLRNCPCQNGFSD
jgi:hypothetical protein